MLICLLSYGRHGFVTTSTGFVYCDKYTCILWTFVIHCNFSNIESQYKQHNHGEKVHIQCVC